MSFLVNPTKPLKEKMMNEWAKIPEEGRPTFQEWCRLKTVSVLMREYEHGIA